MVAGYFDLLPSLEDDLNKRKQKHVNFEFCI